MTAPIEIADWSELLPELLIKIVENIYFYEDLISFSGVCNSWRSAANTRYPKVVSEYPILMLAENIEDEDGKFRQFFHISDHTISTAPLPEASKRRCFSSLGWLLTIAKEDTKVKLIHPSSRIQLILPTLDTLPDFDFHIIFKVLLSADPFSSPEFLVMVVWGCGRQLAFCRPGDRSWTCVKINWQPWLGTLHDITYHHGNRRLYTAMNPTGNVMVCDVHGSDPILSEVSRIPNETLSGNERVYLLDWEDDKLLIIVRNGMWGDNARRRGYMVRVGAEDEELWRTYEFKVFQYDLVSKEWLKVDDLGDYALFLGYNSSFAIKAGRFVETNCIYFTDDFIESYSKSPKGGGFDMGVYCLFDGSIKPLFNWESRSLVSPPIWVEQLRLGSMVA